MHRFQFNCPHGAISVLVLALLLAVFASISAAAPSNDLCSGAIVISPAGPFPLLMPVIPDIATATTNGDPTRPSCATTSVSRSVWYSFRPNTSAEYVFWLNSDTLTTVSDTLMALYSSPSNCTGPLTEVVCNDDEGTGLRSAFLVSLSAGVQYYAVIWVWGTNAPATNAASIQLRVSRPIAPTNDTCATAQMIPAGGQFPYFTPIADLTKATVEAVPSAPSCSAIVSKSVWYRFTPAETSAYRFSTCVDTATTVEDTVMAIYIADGCAGPFTEVACSDDDCDRRGVIDTVLSSGTTYYVVIWEYNDEPSVPGQSLVQLRVSVPPPVFTSTLLLPNGGLRMNFHGLAGQTYAIEAATTFTNWVEIGSGQPLGGGQFQFTATNNVGLNRYFRVRVR